MSLNIKQYTYKDYYIRFSRFRKIGTISSFFLIIKNIKYGFIMNLQSMALYIEMEEDIMQILTIVVHLQAMKL